MLSSNTSAVSGDTTYIEDVFSTWLYTGNGSTQTITNNIDLSTKGGLVWGKNRTAVGSFVGHYLADSARTNGIDQTLKTNTTAAQAGTTAYTSFNTNGFSVGATDYMNINTGTYVTWTFRKQPKFFDVVTYTGNGTSQNIAHSLGSVPGCIMVKATSGVSNWFVYHRSLGNANLVYLNATSASASTTIWNNTDPTSTQFSINGTSGNASGVTYVAYIFAHNAGGFGLTGTDNVISCGSFTTDGSGNGSATVGFESQYVLIKNSVIGSGGDNNWMIYDTMRGLTVDGKADYFLYANTADAEGNGSRIGLNATGFTCALGNSETYIYIAIRRGPMKVPTDATKVFNTVLNTGNSTAKNVTGTGFPPDLLISGLRTSTSGYQHTFQDRLRGAGQHIGSTSNSSELTDAASLSSFLMDGVLVGTDGSRSLTNATGRTYAFWQFKRAPSFFDEVCYTGNGSASQTITHKFGATPELMIVKCRDAVDTDWWVLGAATPLLMTLNSTSASTTGLIDNLFGDQTVYVPPTATNFTVGYNAVLSGNDLNSPNRKYVAYLFATCAGVSKVGTYTGTGATQTIDCGFAGGARFVLVKRTNSTGAWYVWDTARGMVSGTDPSLQLNSLAAEVNANSIYTATGGFQIVSTATGINASGSTYLYLAIA